VACSWTVCREGYAWCPITQSYTEAYSLQTVDLVDHRVCIFTAKATGDSNGGQNDYPTAILAGGDETVEETSKYGGLVNGVARFIIIIVLITQVGS
jgi:hypothetical protein